MMQGLREMMTELMGNNGPSKSSSAEGSAAVRGNPRGAEPTSVRETFAFAAGGGALGDSTATIEAILRENDSRNFGLTGRRGAAVPVEVAPVRGQPYQQRGGGQWGAYPGGELGFGCDLSVSRLALKHTVVPLFRGKKPEFTAWTSDARKYVKEVGFLSAFVSDMPQYIPPGELGTEKTVLVDKEYSH